MVMQRDMDWLSLYKSWQQKQSQYFPAQKALDDTMSSYLAAKGPPPSRREIKEVEDLRYQMFESRAAMDEFIAAHAANPPDKHNLPGHE